MSDPAPPLVPIGINTPSGRVGSTLLMKLLGTSDTIVFDRRPPYEVRHLSYLMSLVELANPDPIAIREMRTAGPVIDIQRSDVCDIAELERRMATSVWGAFAASVRSSHPDARFYAEKMRDSWTTRFDLAGIDRRSIDLVRDPRDMWASIRAFDAQRGYYGFGRAPDQSEQDYLFKTVAILRRRLPEFGADDEHSILVRYEDMMTDLDAVATRISGWLGVELDAERARADDPKLADHRTAVSDEASMERWRSDLDPVEAQYITERLRPHLERFGYSVDV